jgi:hypothetical protein
MVSCIPKEGGMGGEGRKERGVVKEGGMGGEGRREGW